MSYLQVIDIKVSPRSYQSRPRAVHLGHPDVVSLSILSFA